MYLKELNLLNLFRIILNARLLLVYLYKIHKYQLKSLVIV